MDIHKNARLTPKSRALLVERIRQQGWSAARAAAAAGVSERTAWKWLARHRTEGDAGLNDRSSRPRRFHQTNAEAKERIVVLRRDDRLTCRRIAREMACSTATVARIVRAAGLSRLTVNPAPSPAVRYNYAEPGGLLHLDIKKLGRFDAPGHRITRDRSRRSRYLGWDFVHVCIDDASRVAYAEILDDETSVTTIGFFDRAVQWFANRGVTAQRVMTDNGVPYRSHAFADRCQTLQIRHIRTRPYTPRTNGKAERLIQTLMREWAYAVPVSSSQQRAQLLSPYLHFYNQHRAHSAHSGLPPFSKLSLNNVLRIDT